MDFKKATKSIIKSGKLMITCKDDTIYFCDGYKAFKMPLAMYNYYIRPLNAVFIEMQDGEKASKGERDVLPVKSPVAFDVSAVFKNIPNNIGFDTHFVFTSIVNKKPVEYSIFKGAELIALNRDYLQGIDGEIRATNKNSAVYFINGDVTALILPLKLQGTMFADCLAVLKG